ncbi:unnamed protein product, partial [Didymodactylos carnosus]
TITVKQLHRYASIQMKTADDNMSYPARLKKEIKIPSGHEIVVTAWVGIQSCKSAVFQPDLRMLYKRNLLIPNALVEIQSYKMLSTIRNPNKYSIMLQTNTQLGEIFRMTSRAKIFALSSNQLCQQSNIDKKIPLHISIAFDALLKHIDDNRQRQQVQDILNRHYH